MIVTPLRLEHIGEVQRLTELGGPYLQARALSDGGVHPSTSGVDRRASTAGSPTDRRDPVLPERKVSDEGEPFQEAPVRFGFVPQDTVREPGGPGWSLRCPARLHLGQCRGDRALG